MRLNERLWIRFLETPLAELAEYGVNLQTIGMVEDRWGLYVKNVQGVTMEQLEAIMNMGEKRSQAFVRGLHLLKSAIEKEMRAMQ